MRISFSINLFSAEEAGCGVDVIGLASVVTPSRCIITHHLDFKPKKPGLKPEKKLVPGSRDAVVVQRTVLRTIKEESDPTPNIQPQISHISPRKPARNNHNDFSITYKEIG